MTVDRSLSRNTIDTTVGSVSTLIRLYTEYIEPRSLEIAINKRPKPGSQRASRMAVTGSSGNPEHRDRPCLVPLVPVSTGLEGQVQVDHLFDLTSTGEIMLESDEDVAGTVGI